jgi:hypothetical protein
MLGKASLLHDNKGNLQSREAVIIKCLSMSVVRKVEILALGECDNTHYWTNGYEDKTSHARQKTQDVYYRRVKTCQTEYKLQQCYTDEYYKRRQYPQDPVSYPVRLNGLMRYLHGTHQIIVGGCVIQRGVN